MIIWANRRLTTSIGLRVRATSEYAIWPDCPKTATGFTAATGARTRPRCTLCPTGRGRDAIDRFRLRWNDVVYEPGELKVVAYDAKGRAADTLTVKTAGAPARMELKADRQEISSKGHDLSFVTVTMVDKDGTPCLTANNELAFNVEGAGAFRAVCNGDATSLVTFNSRQMPLFNGQLVVIVEGLKPGTATLTVSCDGLPDSTLPITVK